MRTACPVLGQCEAVEGSATSCKSQLEQHLRHWDSGRQCRGQSPAARVNENSVSGAGTVRGCGEHRSPAARFNEVSISGAETVTGSAGDSHKLQVLMRAACLVLGQQEAVESTFTSCKTQ